MTSLMKRPIGILNSHKRGKIAASLTYYYSHARNNA